MTDKSQTILISGFILACVILSVAYLNQETEQDDFQYFQIRIGGIDHNIGYHATDDSTILENISFDGEGIISFDLKSDTGGMLAMSFPIELYILFSGKHVYFTPIALSNGEEIYFDKIHDDGTTVSYQLDFDPPHDHIEIIMVLYDPIVVNP